MHLDFYVQYDRKHRTILHKFKEMNTFYYNNIQRSYPICQIKEVCGKFTIGQSTECFVAFVFVYFELN